jgi:outer membrane receptor protein involved in Fe transport
VQRRNVLISAALALAVFAAPLPALAQAVAGPWHGVLVAGPNLIRLAVKLSAKDGGGYAGGVGAPDRSPRMAPLADIAMTDGKLSFTAPAIGARYEAHWDQAKSAWVGTWSQGPANLPLTLEMGDWPAAAPPAPTSAAAPAKPPPAVSGLTVRGQSQTIRTDIDRRSYDITKDLQAQSGSIADALRNLPSVDVDVQGAVSLRGDPNVTIMIDGKPSSLFKGIARGQVLQSLPANGFERVEVMTNPSAAYRPDGSAGIINLISKKTRQPGKGGSVRVTAAGLNKGSAVLHLSSTGRKLTLSGDLFGFHEKQSVSIADRRGDLDPVSGRLLDSAQETARPTTLGLVYGRAAFDYDTDTRTRLSGELKGTALDVAAREGTDFSGLAPGGAQPRGYHRDGDGSYRRDDVTGELSWRRKLGSDPDHELVLDATQERTTDDSHRRATTIAFGPGLPSTAEDIRYAAAADQTHLKADYTRPFDSGVRLKAGYELEYDRNGIDNFGLLGPTAGQVAPNPGLIDRFRVRQTIHSGYLTWQQPLSASWTALAGLRVENTRIALRDPTTGFHGVRDDTRLYPSLHLTWKRTDADQLTASYSERIQRPNPTDYNPFPMYRDPINYAAGNPALKPQVTHAFELGWQHHEGTTYYLATLYWRRNDRGVTDVVSNLGGGVLLTTKQNLSKSDNGGLELVAAGHLTPKLSYNLSGNAYWTQIDAAQFGFSSTRSAWTVAGRGSLTWQITPKDQVQLNGSLTGKRLTPQGYHEPLGQLFIGYQRKLTPNWSIYVAGRDLLDSYKDVLVLDTPALRDRVTMRVKQRALLVGVTHVFGSGAGRRDPGIDFGASGAAAGASH